MGKLIVELPDELHASLKKQALTDRKTLKAVVLSLIDHYLHQPTPASSTRDTGLCGAWKDARSAETLVAEIRSARRWWTRTRA